MGSPALIANFGDLLEPDHRKVFHDQWKIRPSVIPILFSEINSSKPYETFTEIGAFGDWSDFTADPNLNFQELEQLYDKKLTYIEYATGYRIGRRLKQDNRYPVFTQLPKKLGLAGANMREKHGVAIFNDMFTEEPSDGDGCELCASDHPYSPSSGNTWSNEGTSLCSVTSVAATRLLMMKFKNDREEIGNTTPDMLFGGIDMEETFWEIISSTGKVDTADNNPNFHKGKYKALTSDKFTDTNNWCMIDSRKMKEHLHFINRFPPEFAQDQQFETWEAKFSAYMAYIFGWTKSDWIYGHKVS